ncbi:MAG: hypothetical protein ACKOWN_00450 [Microbacteriaceae bacterium]
MVPRALIALVAIGVLVGLPMPAVGLSCTLTEIVAGVCSVGGGTDGTDVNLWVDGSTNGGSSGGGSTNAGDSVDCTEVVEGRCVGSSPPKKVDKPETVHDLESLRPARPNQGSEPAGWTIAGLPTNFLSFARTHIVTGELGGFSAEVRFIPVGYRRSFGDGTSGSTRVKGTRWTTPWVSTPTSHTYSTTGAFTVGLTVTYIAEYRYGSGGWTRLGGVVTRTAPDLRLRAFSADTVLVARSCSAGAIGCA